MTLLGGGSLHGREPPFFCPIALLISSIVAMSLEIGKEEWELLELEQAGMRYPPEDRLHARRSEIPVQMAGCS